MNSLDTFHPETYIKRYDSIDQHPLSPPDLLNDSEEDDEDSLDSPSLSPKPFHNLCRRKSVPHKSPAVVGLFDKSIVFQLDELDVSRIIYGPSLLTPLRKRVFHGRVSRRVRTASIIEIPRSQNRSSVDISFKKPTPRSPHPASGRPSRVKGPCQACQEASDGCMRKAFDWPFPTTQTFNDKGKPFVYLCNKCGLRYNKSGGCVCRHCRWVFCKEEKRKALQHIDAMRQRRPDGYVDPNEDIENFVCSPKYWACGRPWKVGWVLNNLEEDEEI